MSTWIAAIVDTGGRTDFWTVARRNHVTAVHETVPARALIDCTDTLDFEASTRLAQALSGALGTSAIGLFLQTVSDVYGVRVFERGQIVRRLEYSPDGGGWLTVTGTAQPWESALFFDGPADPTSDTHWPDTIYDDLEDADIARYEAARRRGDASDVMDLVHATHEGIHRVALALGVRPDTHDAHYRKPRWWQRLGRATR